MSFFILNANIYLNWPKPGWGRPGRVSPAAGKNLFFFAILILVDSLHYYVFYALGN